MTRLGMMGRGGVAALGLVMGMTGAVGAQPLGTERVPPSVETDPRRPDLVVLQALKANPITAPYPINTAIQDGRVVISGRVGTKLAYDAAIRTVMATGYPYTDRLVIDTAEAHRAAAETAAVGPAAGGPGPLAPAVPGPGWNLGFGLTAGVPPYIYPPPLFGRYDDPFFGFEPPVISYPPWWWAMTAYRNPEALPPYLLQAPWGPEGPPEMAAEAPPSERPSPEGTVEMVIDPLGVAILRGRVRTLEDRIILGQALARAPGIHEVINLLEVAGEPSDSDEERADVPLREVPPPPPRPEPPPDAPRDEDPVPPPPRPEPEPELEPDPQPPPDPDAAEAAIDPFGARAFDRALTRRLADALAKRPALGDHPIQVSAQHGVALLSGEVPTVYEAMLAFRALQQTPGVHHIVDRLRFTVPDGQRPNPLLTQGRPEDVEPYLEAQIRRQIGDLAHIDRVRLNGDRLQVRGTLVSEEDRPRVEAILRSMAVLRGFQLDTALSSD